MWKWVLPEQDTRYPSQGRNDGGQGGTMLQAQGRIKWTRGPGQSRDREAPVNASRNCVAFHMSSFQLCRSTG